MTVPESGPPRWAERLLGSLLGERPSAAFLIGDLREDFRSVAIGYGQAAASFWYLVVVLRVGLRLRFTSVDQVRSVAPSLTRHPGDSMRTELSLAFRSLTRRPVLSTAIILTIGSALAVATISFATVNGVLLRPLPFTAPDRLVTIWERSLVRGNPRNVVSPANFIAWTEGLKKVERLAGVFETSVPLTTGDRAEQVGIVYATGSFFPLLGSIPLAGRLLAEADAVEGAAPVVVVAERYWRAKMGADPNVVGTMLMINGTSRQLVGVLPDNQEFVPANSWAGVGSRDFYEPWQLGPKAREWGGRFMQIIGRLAPGASLSDAQQEASTLATRLRELFPERQEGWDINMVSLHDDIVRNVRSPIAVVFAAVCFVLLIACANVANLLMSRATERRAEMAIRSALGAGRWALARQLFGESLLLVGLGGLVGLGLSTWGIAALIRTSPDLPRLGEVHVDGSVLGFVLFASAIVAGLVGLGPAIAASSKSPVIGFAQRGSVTDRRSNRARSALVAVQVALSVILLGGAGVLIRSLVNRLSVNLGVETEGVLTARLNFPEKDYPSAERRAAALEAVLEKIKAVPGVAVAAAGSIVPMSPEGQSTSFMVLDRPQPEAGQFPVADVRFVQHDYFAALGIPIVSGRSLAESDRLGMPTAVLINQTGARLYWPGENAVGKRIQMEWGDTLRAEIVGVVGDVMLRGPDADPEKTTLYWDYRQSGAPSGMSLVVRGRDAEPAIAPIRAALSEVDPNLPLYNVRSMATLRARTVAQSRFITASLVLFASLALGLALLGVYGVMSNGVEQRTREIGVRLALGADRSSVIRMLLRQGALVVVPALAVGVVASLLLTGFLRSLVYGVNPRDPISLIGSLVVIGGAALAACWIPARRASGIPAVEAIRTD